jgi:hypothetical protein
MKLMAANALLTRSHKVKGQKPFMQFDMGAFKQGFNRYRKMLATGIALVKTGAVAFACKFGDLLSLATTRTKRTIRPAKFLKVLSGLVFVGENWVCEVCAHGD